MSEPASISLGIAARYASALFDLAKDGQALTALEADTDALEGALARLCPSISFLPSRHRLYVPYLLGTDNQGRDILSAILYGSRMSIIIGVATVVCSLIVGIGLGLVAGFFGGWVDNALMRFGDVLLSVPTILIAMLVSAVARASLPESLREVGAGVVLVLALTLSAWVQYARTVRAQTAVERGKEYVQAARLLKVPARRIMFKHILPNTMTPILVAATLNFGMAILSEATLSFLGIGMPPSQPSLGTLIRFGNQYLFSGMWWMVIFPVVQLCLLVVSVNLLGDWLRDALNPKLR